jgi:hypothetical protein
MGRPCSGMWPVAGFLADRMSRWRDRITVPGRARGPWSAVPAGLRVADQRVSPGDTPPALEEQLHARLRRQGALGSWPVEGRRHLAGVSRGPVFNPVLTASAGVELARGLRTMPVVRWATSRSGEDPRSAFRADRDPWEIPLAWLQPDIRVHGGASTGSEGVATKLLIGSGDVPEHAKNNIAQAMVIVANLVEPEVLKKVGIPGIHVHICPDKSLLKRVGCLGFRPKKGFRAYLQSDVQEIHIGQNDLPKTIVHEIGHQLENQLPITVWLDIQRLLRGRHQAYLDKHGETPEGKDVLIRIDGAGGRRKKWPEAAYQAVMPVTGTYSAKCYGESGPTEVMSTSMEFLAERDKADDLIGNDPLQAAIILRAIAPEEFDKWISPRLKALLP